MILTLTCKNCDEDFKTHHIEKYWCEKTKQIVYLCGKCRPKYTKVIDYSHVKVNVPSSN